MSKSQILKEYYKQKEAYSKLAGLLSPLMESIISGNGLQCQSVSARLKNEDSIAKNCAGGKYKNKKSIESLSEIPDIVGCRIIFYASADVERFESLIKDEFEVLNRKSTITLYEGYQGVNIDCKLGKKRKELSEYKEVSNLPFEIQITTVLFHGWNEWEHDLFYKDALKVQANFPKQFDALKKSARGLSQELSDIQSSIEKIGQEYLRASEGKEIFSITNQSEYTKSQNNNEIFDHLSILNDFLSNFGTFPEDLDIKDLLTLFERIIDRSKKNRIKKIPGLISKMSGRTRNDILGEVLKILEKTFYPEPILTVRCAIRIYQTQDPKGRFLVVEWFRSISKYKYVTLKEQGYIVQSVLIDEIKKWSIKDIRINYEILCAISESLFKTDFSDAIQADYKTFTLQRGGLPRGEEVKRIRDQAIRLLTKAYQATEKMNERISIVNVLNQSIYFSEYENDFNSIVKLNQEKIIDFYVGIIENASTIVLSEIDSAMDYIVRTANTRVVKKAQGIIDLLKDDADYRFHKDFVGYLGDEKLRGEKTAEYINNICDENKNEWIRRIIKISRGVIYNDAGKYHYFGIFLKDLSTKNFELGYKLLNNKKLIHFREPIISGLLLNKKRKNQKVIKGYIDENISNGLMMREILGAHRRLNLDDKKTLNRIYIESLKKKRAEKINLLHQLLEVINYRKKYKDLFLKIITEFSVVKYYNWSSNFYARSEVDKDNLLYILSEKEWGIVLSNMTYIQRIDYHEECILVYLIEKFPKLFVDFFEKRVKLKQQMNTMEYAAIPFRFNYLQEEKVGSLKRNREVIIDRLFNWTGEQELSWQYGSFMKVLFPHSDAYLEQKLNTIIDQKSKSAWLKYVFPYIKWNQGLQIERYVKRTVIRHEKDKEIWNYCKNYMLNLGGVSGSIDEPIMANAYQKMKEHLSKWKTRNSKLKEFQKECFEYLDYVIEDDKRRHDREMRARKRNSSS